MNYKKIIGGLASVVLLFMSIGGTYHYYKIEKTKKNGSDIYIEVLDKIQTRGAKPKKILCLAFDNNRKLYTRDSKTFNSAMPGKYSKFKYMKEWDLVVAENEPTIGAFILLLGIFIISLKCIHLIIIKADF